jgi:DNA invertase Pin-like site-specific DNA recombinase
MIMKVGIYTRVSTDGQSVNAQLADLREVAERRGWEIVHEYTDKGISGAKGRENRPGLDAMLKAATRREFDMVAAWSVDRLGRSLQHLVAGLGDLQAAGVGLYLHKQGLDTSTPSGRAMFGMLSVFAEFERELIRERVRAGMKIARAEQASGKERLHKNGRVKKSIGRPRVKPEIERRVRELRSKDWGVNRIASELGIGSGTVRRITAA